MNTGKSCWKCEFTSMELLPVVQSMQVLLPTSDARRRTRATPTTREDSCFRVSSAVSSTQKFTGCKIMHLFPSLLHVAKTRRLPAAGRHGRCNCSPSFIGKPANGNFTGCKTMQLLPVSHHQRRTPLSSPASRRQHDAVALRVLSADLPIQSSPATR